MSVVRAALSTLAGALLLAGCATPPPARPVAYHCDDGRRFAIAFGDQAAVIEIDGMRFPLRQERAASGVRYACDVLEFSAKGDEARVDVQGERAYTGCRADP